MKKVLPIIVLSFLLLGMAGGVVLAAPGAACCNADDCDDGETCSVNEPDGCDASDQGECVAGTGDAPMTIKEYCTLSNDIIWKSGHIDMGGDDTDCTVGDHCQLTDGERVGPPTSGDGVEYKTDEWGIICLINTVTTATNWIFYLMMAFVVVMIVIGGATYMLAAGNPEKAAKGKGIIIYGIIGLVIALVARIIPSVVKMIVGMS